MDVTTTNRVASATFGHQPALVKDRRCRSLSGGVKGGTDQGAPGQQGQERRVSVKEKGHTVDFDSDASKAPGGQRHTALPPPAPFPRQTRHDDPP